MGSVEKRNNKALNTKELCNMNKEAKPWPIKTSQGFNIVVLKMCIGKCSLKKMNSRKIVGI
jgi:hypothetical protein